MVMKYIGLRVRPQAGDPDEVVEIIAVLGNAATIGLQTDVLEASQRQHSISSGPDSELEEWFPDAIVLWAYVQSMLELDDDNLTDAERRL